MTAGVANVELWKVFIPAALCGFWSLGDRSALAAFWFPTMLWMLVIVDRTSGSDLSPDHIGMALLALLALGFFVFLRARESRRVGLWREVSVMPLALVEPAKLLKEPPGRGLARAGWTVMATAITVAITAWVAPLLWQLEPVRGEHRVVTVAMTTSAPAPVIVPTLHDVTPYAPSRYYEPYTTRYESPVAPVVVDHHAAAPVDLPCCPVAEQHVQIKRARVKEYLDLGLGHDDGVEKESPPQSACRACPVETGITVASGDPVTPVAPQDWPVAPGPAVLVAPIEVAPEIVVHEKAPEPTITVHGNDDGDVDGDEDGGDGDADGRPSRRHPHQGATDDNGPHTRKPKHHRAPHAHAPAGPSAATQDSAAEHASDAKPSAAVAQAPKAPPAAPPSAPAAAPAAPAVAPSAPAAPAPAAPAVPAAPAPAVATSSPTQPAHATSSPAHAAAAAATPTSDAQAHQPPAFWHWLVAIGAALLIFQLVTLGLRPLRRLVTLRHLRRPFWPESIDQQVSNSWQLALIGLRDAGWRPDSGEAPRELAARVNIDGVERCAQVLERARHGLGIDAGDLSEIRTQADLAYHSARGRLSRVPRTLSWLRWPLA
jgi:hypothetical protein